MTNEAALIRLAESTAAAVAGVLTTVVGETVERGSPALVPDGSPPLATIEVPAVATSVAYVDGVRGGNVFIITALGARRLAAAMTGTDPSDDGAADLTELELSAVGEAMSQMMDAAAGATGEVVGQEVEVGAPETQILLTEVEAAEAFESGSRGIATPFIVCGEPAQFVQLVPQAFVVRLTQAFTDLDALGVGGHDGPPDTVPGHALRSIPVRVSAELGRFRMGIGRAVGLPVGSVVTLDSAADDPVTLLVNGRPFGRARLLVGEDGDWAVRLESLDWNADSAAPPGIAGEA